MSSQASKSAASTQASAARDATQLQAAEFNQTTANLAPYLEAGTGALPTLQGLLGTGGQAPNPTAFTSSPGYQFMMNQGTNAVQNSAAARGGVNSGNTLKSLTQYGQGLANQTYQQYLGNIQGLVGMGQNAAAMQGGFAQNFGAQAGANMIGAGNALAAGQVGSANAINAGIGGVGQAGMNYALMDYLRNQQPSVSPGTQQLYNLYGMAPQGPPPIQYEPTVPASYP